MAESLQATQIRRGNTVVHDGVLYKVLDFEHRTQGRKSGFVQVKFRNVLDGTQREVKFSATDFVERAVIETREMDYLYADGQGHVFMDVENYEQTTLDASLLGEALPWLSEGMRVLVEWHEGRPIGVVLPKTVEVEVAESEPVVRGQTAGQTAARSSKPATLANGIAIQVPQFINAGDRIRVDTSDGHYIERVK
jgi:elongation factor P